jgi:FMN phosphatase YigB (HAD superfamily)
MWLHIGDEYDKDYVGATQASLEALLLKRDKDDDMLHKGPMPEKDVPTISTLSEASMVINVKARQFFEQVDS